MPQHSTFASIEPIIDHVNLAPFIDFVSALTNYTMSESERRALEIGVADSDVETGDRFEFNRLTPNIPDSYATFASETGHDFHKLHMQIRCPDWMAAKINTAASLMNRYRLSEFVGRTSIAADD